MSLKRSRLLPDLNVNTRNIAPLIDVRSLSNGRHDFAFAPTAATLDLDADKFGDLVVDVVVDVGREIVVDLEATATARLTCSRTLAEFDERISGSARLLAVQDGSDVLPTNGDLSDEPDFIAIVEGIVDLTIPARDVILLAVPLRPVAPDAVNIELRTSFGDGDDDVDPRWRALEKLRAADETPDDSRDAR